MESDPQHGGRSRGEKCREESNRGLCSSKHHLAMNEDQITEILYTDHYLLSAGGGFSGGKLLNTQGE